MSRNNSSPPPGDDQPPALPDAGDHAGESHAGRAGRATRHYSSIERAGLTWLAIRDGISVTADREGVPRSTLTGWLEQTGGAGPIQEWLCVEALRSFLRFEQDFYAEATRRLEKMPNDEFGMTLRKLVDARALVPAQQAAVQSAGQPALAAANATVELHVTEEDGKVTVTELGPPPEDE